MKYAPRMSTAACALALLAGVLAAPRAARADGEMVARAPDGAERGSFPLTRTEVHAEVTGQVVSVDVTQRFENPFREHIEAVYTFPLPTEAAVDDMEFRVGARVVRSVIHRRGEARMAYNAAANNGQRAALLEQERPNMFTVSVANIDPGGAIEVHLHYFEMAHYDHGTYEMVFPMTVGPRYIPGAPINAITDGAGVQAPTNRVPDADRISPAHVHPGMRSGHTVGMTVDLDAGSSIATLESPAHPIQVQRRGRSGARITLRDQDEIPNRDFVLRWSLAAPDVQAAMFVHRSDAHSPGYFALALEPRHDVPDGEIAPREIFFLLDTSGSMQGPPLDAALTAVRRALTTLHPMDTFQIIDFADRASSFSQFPLENNPANIQRAMEYLGHLQASGGTNQLAGIHAALSAPGDAMRLRYVVFLTDGYIGNESEVIGLVQREIGRARIFGFGIGGSVNRFLLDEVSYNGRGAAEYILPHESPNAAVERFYQRIGRPYLTDIAVDWGGLPIDSTLPSPMPDLSTFEPLMVMGRFRGPAEGNITVRGRAAGRPFERVMHVALPAVAPEGMALSRIWARARITNLTRATHFQGETAQLVSDITETALAHNLVSRYTSLVAIQDVQEASARQAPPRTVAQPSESPAGVNVPAAGGTQVTAAPARPRSGSSAPPPNTYAQGSTRATQGNATPPAAQGPGNPSPIVPPIYGTRPGGEGTNQEINGTPLPVAPPPPPVNVSTSTPPMSAPENEERRGYATVHATSAGSPGSADMEAVRRHGGCAGCTVDTGHDRSQGALTLTLLGLGTAAIVVRARRRRGRGAKS